MSSHKSKPYPNDNLTTKDRLTVQQIEELKEVFALMDKDGDGKVSSSEIKILLKLFRIKCSDADAQKIIDKYDINKDGFLQFDEYLEMITPTLIHVSDDMLKHAFHLFDKNSQNKISAEDLKQFFLKLKIKMGEDEIVLMMKEADKMLLGYIDFEQFKVLLPRFH